MRRCLLAAAVVAGAGAVALTGVQMAAAAEGPAQPTVEQIPLEASPAGAPAGWQGEATVDANLVGIEWTGGDDARFALEVRGTDGVWRPAGAVGLEDNGPDAGTAEAARAATAEHFSEPIWVDDVSAVRVRLDNGVVDDVTLHAVDSPPVTDGVPLGADPAQSGVVGGLAAVAIASAVVACTGRRRRAVAAVVLVALVAAGCYSSPGGTGSVPERVVSRAEWGGNMKWNCTGGPEYATTLTRAIVHHTAGSNTYTQAESPSVVRGIWAYHTQSLGYCDIAYNFLVDRFGTIYEGRAGGIARAVVGAHAQSANTGSTGISVMGTFSTSAPPVVAQNALMDLLAWKLGVHKLQPSVTTIIGHRNVNSTECPGNAFYPLLPALRDGVKTRMLA